LSLVHHPDRSNINPSIHRDLKPDNIIHRASDNKLVLIDFGGVKQIRRPNPNHPNTQISTIGFGTPGEQGWGKPRLASDIYAVGAIAVQCLTGKHPTSLLNGDTLEFDWRHLCLVSDEFADILTKMTQSRAIYRYQDAAEVKCEIESLLPSAASTPTPTQPSFPYIPSPSPPSNPLPKTIFVPVLKTIPFTSVKLDNRGKIIAKPKGKAEVFEQDLGKGISMTMVKIPAGKVNPLLGGGVGSTSAAVSQIPHVLSIEKTRSRHCWWVAKIYPPRPIGHPSQEGIFMRHWLEGIFAIRSIYRSTPNGAG
jgi:eukaryotic-like serine/threonine-protein kinase